MVEVEDTRGRFVLLSNGVRIPAPGPVAEAQAFEETVVVVLTWISGRRRSGWRRVRADNVYGYDFQGRRRWRVGSHPDDAHGRNYAGFIEHAPGPTLFEVAGWHVTLDESTGKILRSECVR